MPQFNFRADIDFQDEDTEVISVSEPISVEAEDLQGAEEMAFYKLKEIYEEDFIYSLTILD